MSRPERESTAQDFYNQEEAEKYTRNTRMTKIQRELTERCLELIGLDEPNEEPQFVLDLGCGSGLSGDVLTENGHVWTGIDISNDMLHVALSKDTEGELVEGDMGQGFNVQPGFFDACISISALQWLSYVDKKNHNPWLRLNAFFQSLHKALKQGGKAGLQFYPEDEEQVEQICNAAMKNGFSGGLLIDYPNSSTAKKYYLVVSNIAEGKLKGMLFS